MKLQQLLEAMNAAKTALDGSPEDDSLKAKFNEAKQAYESAKAEADGNSEDADELDDSALDDKTKAYLKKLRGENAKHRTKNKELTSKLTGFEGTLAKLKAAFGGEDEQTDPAELAQSLQARNEALEVELGIAQLTMEHGIPTEGQKYFRFLIEQQADELAEGEEISDEQITKIVAEVSKTIGKGKGSTNANSTGLNGGKRPDPDAAGAVTVEQFSKMTIAEKNELFLKDQQQYQKLFNAAVEKRLI